MVHPYYWILYHIWNCIIHLYSRFPVVYVLLNILNFCVMLSLLNTCNFGEIGRLVGVISFNIKPVLKIIYSLVCVVHVVSQFFFLNLINMYTQTPYLISSSLSNYYFFCQFPDHGHLIRNITNFNEKFQQIWIAVPLLEEYLTGYLLYLWNFT